MHPPLEVSPLVRAIGDWVDVDPETGTQDVAQRLGQWLSVHDTIRLHAWQQAGATAPAARRPRLDTAALGQEAQRLRATLAQAITSHDPGAPTAPAPRGARTAAPPVADPAEADGLYALYHQRHLELQRQMDLRIDAWRGHLRQLLVQRGPAQASLARLDALMEDALQVRVQRVLAWLPGLLDKRFAHWRRSATDHTGALINPGWLAAYAHEWRTALLAELDWRLQATDGLLAALCEPNEQTT